MRRPSRHRLRAERGEEMPKALNLEGIALTRDAHKPFLERNLSDNLS